VTSLPALSVNHKMLTDFYEATGYGPSDLLAMNKQTRLIMTRNGGLYHVKESGIVKRLKGPPVDPTERD